MAQQKKNAKKSKVNTRKKAGTFTSDLDSSPLKGKNTRGTKGEQMRIDPEAHGLVIAGRKSKSKGSPQKRAIQ